MYWQNKIQFKMKRVSKSQEQLFYSFQIFGFNLFFFIYVPLAQDPFSSQLSEKLYINAGKPLFQSSLGIIRTFLVLGFCCIKCYLKQRKIRVGSFWLFKIYLYLKIQAYSTPQAMHSLCKAISFDRKQKVSGSKGRFHCNMICSNVI